MRTLNPRTFSRLACAALAGAGLAMAWTAGASAAPGAMPSPAAAVAAPTAPLPAVQVAPSPISLESGVGRVLMLGADAANVFVADPKVAEVRPASANTLFVFGVGPGRTTVAAMDAAGRMLAQFDVTVRRSGFAAAEAEATLARLMPASHIGVQPQAKGLLLTGNVTTAGEASRAASIARGFLGETGVIENQISVSAQVQVTLRVRIAEMSKSVTRSLGVNWAALGSIGKFSVAFLTANPTAAFNIPSTGTLLAGFPDVAAIIDALAQENLARVLAEPNLTVMSGEPASFLVGGEFPIPVAQQSNTVTIDFKKYGITLSFVPTVLSDGRINLHVNPEVSQLTDTGAVKMSASNSSISVPALLVRRAETTVELGSGQTFAIAGLLSDQSSQVTNGLPFLGDIPVLGALFRSNAFQRNETELVIMVTPYIVRPVSNPGALGLPTDNTPPPSDLDRILRLRQIARSDPSVPSRIPGQAGFIIQ